MTFILALDSPQSSWMVADRRLSIAGVPVRDDARKIMLLDAADGFAIIGYSGLGCTKNGTEPSDWMSGILRDRPFPLETCLGLLADVMRRELEPHLPTLSGPGPFDHVAVATGFLGEERRMYAIDISVAPDGMERRFDCHRYEIDMVSCGTGRKYIEKNLPKYNELGRLINLVDQGTVAPERVADYLAALNLRVSKWTSSVGPNCVVAWRRRNDESPGFRYHFYNGTVRQKGDFSIPHVDRGTEINRILDIISRVKSPPGGMGYTRTDGTVVPPADYSSLAEFTTLPNKPDETLR